MNEIWKDIAGYVGLYQVSNLGRVRSFHNGVERIRKPTRGGKVKTCYVHRLVAQAFLPNPEGKREVNHRNGIKTDNRVENLEWVTPSENQKHAVTTGLKQSGEDNYNAKLTNEQARYVRENPDNLTGRQLAEMFEVNKATISLIQRGKQFKNAGGTVRESKVVRVPPETCKQIRREYIYGSSEFGSTALAKKYGVDPTTILKIVREGQPTMTFGLPETCTPPQPQTTQVVESLTRTSPRPLTNTD